jgi:L-methionine (R)-S-oxide reductase
MTHSVVPLRSFFDSQVAAVRSLVENEPSWVVNCSNVSSLLYHSLRDDAHVNHVNWIGFYTARSDGSFRLGPFHGKVACTKIPKGKGVIGASAERGEPLVVVDVHEFPGHIACDSKSESEVVVPIRDKEGKIVAVLDIDAEVKGCFSEEDLPPLLEICEIMGKGCDWQSV